MGAQLCPAQQGRAHLSLTLAGKSFPLGRGMAGAALPLSVSSPGPTSTRSKADGVPPRCTWPRTVTRVSKPRRCTTSCGEEGTSRWGPAGVRGCQGGAGAVAYVLHVVGGDGFAAAVDGALGDDDDVEPRAPAACLARGEDKRPPRLSQNSPWATCERPPLPTIRAAAGVAQVTGSRAPEPALPLAREGWICARLSAPVHRDNGGSSRSFAGAGHRLQGSARAPAGTPRGGTGDGMGW